MSSFSSPSKYDYLICGAGIIGLTIARELLSHSNASICIIEKESSVGVHASGRNSGVLHAGIYYAPETLKAKFCLEGNQLMRAFCQDKGLEVFESGKVLVAKNESDGDTLSTIYERATKNGARCDMIDAKQLAEIEPLAKTHRNALLSHDTAVVDPGSILNALVNELSEKGVDFRFNTSFVSVDSNSSILTSQGVIHYDQFVNAAGAFSDKIAHQFGLGNQYRLLPFKGIYKKASPALASQIKGNIYPVPDIRNPFLGVHFTKSVSGDVYLGPTATPVFGPENYHGLSDIGLESLEILWADAVLFFKNPQFRNVALSEPKKYSHRVFVEEARQLVQHLDDADVIDCNKAGIRPQLVNWDSKQLVMDFVIERGDNSVHILNAISPAFTSSMAFAKYVCHLDTPTSSALGDRV